MSIVTFILSLAVLFLVLAFMSLSRQRAFWENYAEDLENLVDEADKVKQDLNIMLDNAVKISEMINQNLEKKLSGEYFVKPEERIEENASDSKKVCVYEVEKYLGINEKDLINVLQHMDYKVNNQLNTIDIPVLEKIKTENINILDEKSNDEDRLKSTSSIENTNLQANNVVDTEFYQIEDLKNVHPYIAVRLLHEKGYTVKQMAKLLGRGQGEIQILLNLSYKNRAV
ncbi:hypothetical protein [Thermosyntropha sp.]|uniref:hypothetical protein n=1 Tax=Thermosyntropha sp. TaxID=2740820 RepID=UPI0025E7D8A2|nr:hypothetical protein [Thermosyntropha sp.]MBO8159378.1 hypothetical protein [Thermosyntropha sp.]